MKPLLITVLILVVVGSVADLLARFVLFSAGKEPPWWTRYVPFADLYFWWMK